MLKRIFIAADIFPPEIGGPATYSSRLAKELAARGFEVRVLCYARQIKKEKKPAVKIYRVSKRWPMPWRYFLYFLKLFYLAYNFDVIYAQGPVSAGLPSWLVKKLLDKKLIIKVVGDYAWEQAQLASKTEQGIEDWQKKPKFKTHIPARINKMSLLNRVERKVVQGADGVIVPSHYLKEIVLGWGVEKEKVEVIYNAISFKPSKMIKEQARKEIGVSGDILISVGRFMPWKGFDFLIKLMPEILKTNPNFKLIIAGDGPEFRKCQSLIQDLGLIEKVFLPGSLTKEKLALYFRATDLFLLNSAYEGLSHTVLEAMASGLPVLVSDVGGNSEIVDNEISGLLLEYNNKYDWLESIEKIWQDNELRHRLSKAQVPKLSCFNFERMIERTLDVLTVE